MLSRLMKTVIIFILVVSFTKTFSQNGTPFITHYKESKEIETQNWAICQDNENNLLFANRRGILLFDGQQWEMLHLPFIPFAIRKNPHDNIVYVGANNNYGYLKKDEKGFYQYISLLQDSTYVGVITKILFTDKSIYFYGENTISRHEIENPGKFIRWYAKDFKPFTGMFITPKNTFINVYDDGLYRIESDTLFPIVTGYLTSKNEILFSLPYNNDKVLVGTDESKLYLFDGIKYYDYQINDDGYLAESILSDGLVISDSLYAFATLIGGVEIVNKYSGKIVYTINYQNGLPDDEIYSFALDNNKGLWLSHEYGVSRVDFELPLQNYSNYPGLKGNIITSLIHNNELYVATSEGVFYLTEVKNYADVQVLVKSQSKEEKVRVVSDPSKYADQKTVEETGEKRPVKKMFSKLFSKKEEPEKVTEPTVTKEQSIAKTIRTKPQYVKKTLTTIRSIDYIFKKVDGLNEKTKQLVSTDNGILAATNSGLFNISNYRANVVIKDKYINQISRKTKTNQYYATTSNGIFSVAFVNNKWSPQYNFVDFSEPVYSIGLTGDHHVWLGSDDIIYTFLIDELSQPKALRTYKIKTDFPEKYYIQSINDTIVLFLESGMYYHDIPADSFMFYKKELWQNESRFRFILNSQESPWIKYNNEWVSLHSAKSWTDSQQALLKIFADISSIQTDKKNNFWVVADNNQLYKITKSKDKSASPEFNVFFKNVTNKDGIPFELSKLDFDAGNNAIYINIVAPYYVKQNSTQYQYFVDGLMKDWSKWSTSTNINLVVKAGEYTLKVRAKDIWGNISPEKTVDFKIKAPFTQSIWFFLLIGIVILVLFYFVSKIREQKLQHDKKILEQKVVERTLEIQEQKEEIETQRDELAKNRDELLRQKEEITDSITYASRIQRAMLPLREHFNKTFADHFIFYRPRDIVSGDFYWIAENKDKVYFSAADCTGHGVPGAFMSMLGISSLNEIITHTTNNLKANEVLNLLREKIKFSLHQTGKEGETKDGMDIALCILHKNKHLLEYSGAYNPLYLFRNGEIEEYKADRMPIGIYHVEKESFTNYEINIKEGDILYIFSDGFADQFGGPVVTKFKSASMKKMFAEIAQKPMIEQGIIVENTFDQWKGKEFQIDDILVIGIRL